jgi:hypothetical protein
VSKGDSEAGRMNLLAAKLEGMTITLTVLSTLAERSKSAEGENFSAVGGSSWDLRILSSGWEDG